MRELANYEKQESMKAQKVVETLKSEITSLMKDKERLDKQVAKLLEEAIELKEQVIHTYSYCFYFLLNHFYVK